MRQIAADRAYAALVAALKVDFDDAELVGVSSLTHPWAHPNRECRATSTVDPKPNRRSATDSCPPVCAASLRECRSVLQGTPEYGGVLPSTAGYLLQLVLESLKHTLIAAPPSATPNDASVRRP